MASRTTDNLLNNSLPQETSQSSILSVVPSIGPLHISLNSREHIVNSYHPFFKTLYETIFPKSKLADDPKPGELVWFSRLCMVQSSPGSKMQSMGPHSANKTAEYLWCCRCITFLSNLTVSLSILEQWSEFGLCLLASNAGSITMHHFFGSTCALTGENMLHNCRTYQGIALPFLMNILWKTPIAYSVHRHKALILLMNVERKKKKCIFLHK